MTTTAGSSLPGAPESIPRRTMVKASCIAALSVAIGAQGALAWLSGQSVNPNILTVAQNLSVLVVEPSWDPEAASAVVAGQALPKDPRIKNLSTTTTGYVFAEVRTPLVAAALHDDSLAPGLDGNAVELWTYPSPEEKGWVLIEQFTESDSVVRRYGWPAPVAPNATTPALFDEVTTAKVVDPRAIAGEYPLTVVGYGIQSLNISGNASKLSEMFPSLGLESLGSDMERAWVLYKTQNNLPDSPSEAA